MNIILAFNTLIFIIADSSSSDAAALPLLLALSGFIFYAIMYSRYRNADKRHIHEKETATVVANLACSDSFIQKRKGLRNATIAKANHTRVEGALNTGKSNKLLDTVNESFASFTGEPKK